VKLQQLHKNTGGISIQTTDWKKSLERVTPLTGEIFQKKEVFPFHSLVLNSCFFQPLDHG